MTVQKLVDVLGLEELAAEREAAGHEGGAAQGGAGADLVALEALAVGLAELGGEGEEVAVRRLDLPQLAGDALAVVHEGGAAQGGVRAELVSLQAFVGALEDGVQAVVAVAGRAEAPQLAGDVLAAVHEGGAAQRGARAELVSLQAHRVAQELRLEAVHGVGVRHEVGAAGAEGAEQQRGDQGDGGGT